MSRARASRLQSHRADELRSGRVGFSCTATVEVTLWSRPSPLPFSKGGIILGWSERQQACPRVSYPCSLKKHRISKAVDR